MANDNQPDLLEAAAEETDGRRRLDAELRVMGAVLRLLDELPPGARPRVVAWLTSRFSQE